MAELLEQRLEESDNSSSGGETVESRKRRRKISTEVDVVRVGEDVVPNNNCI